MFNQKYWKLLVWKIRSMWRRGWGMWKVSIAESCLTLCHPMDCSLPDSSVHGILQARILEWVAIPFSRGSRWSRDETQVSCIAGSLFTIWATREETHEWHQNTWMTAKKLGPGIVKKSHYLFIYGFLLLLFFKKTFWCGPFFKKSLLNLSQYCFCFMFWFLGCKACGI